MALPRQTKSAVVTGGATMVSKCVIKNWTEKLVGTCFLPSVTQTLFSNGRYTCVELGFSNCDSLLNQRRQFWSLLSFISLTANDLQTAKRKLLLCCLVDWHFG